MYERAFQCKTVSAENMALTQASDDTLSRILYFLSHDDILRLLITGSKRLTARMVQNTTKFDWTLTRPTLFPSFCFTFAKLKSLTIYAGCQRDLTPHLSMKGRSILPLEPMVALESLNFDFQLSSLLFEPQLEHGGLSLSSCFPKLTSLSVSSRSDHALPYNWTESLPKTLLTLSLNIQTAASIWGTEIDPFVFDSLPESLQHLDFGYSMRITPGKLNLRRFANLRSLSLNWLVSWDVLESLPDSLELLVAIFPETDDDLPSRTTFLFSQLPPKLRVLSLNGPCLQIIYDRKALLALEELDLGSGYLNVTEETFKNYFPTNNLRKVLLPEDITPSLMEILPNLEHLTNIYLYDLPSLQILPRNLTSLELFASSDAQHLPAKDLPPKLKKLQSHVFCAEDISDLPRTILKLNLSALKNSVPALPASVWRTLPPKLSKLEVDLHIFDSEECFLVLPGTLQKLHLCLRPNWDESHCAGIIERITFPKPMQESLLHFRIQDDQNEQRETENKLHALIPKFAGFSRLQTLSIRAKMTVNYDTFSNLPKTLTMLELKCQSFENYGLPAGKDRFETDWKEGAFSKLPEGLENLKVSFSMPSAYEIHFGLFSRLPRRLASLEIRHFGNFDPKQFASSLPRRLSYLNFNFRFPVRGNTSQEQFTIAVQEHAIRMKSLSEAIDEYYSDPFWSGFKRRN